MSGFRYCVHDELPGDCEICQRVGVTTDADPTPDAPTEVAEQSSASSLNPADSVQALAAAREWAGMWGNDHVYRAGLTRKDFEDLVAGLDANGFAIVRKADAIPLSELEGLLARALRKMRIQIDLDAPEDVRHLLAAALTDAIRREGKR